MFICPSFSCLTLFAKHYHTILVMLGREAVGQVVQRRADTFTSQFGTLPKVGAIRFVFTAFLGVWVGCEIKGPVWKMKIYDLVEKMKLFPNPGQDCVRGRYVSSIFNF